MTRFCFVVGVFVGNKFWILGRGWEDRYSVQLLQNVNMPSNVSDFHSLFSLLWYSINPDIVNTVEGYHVF